ncbi:hypothetical protein TKK_0011574 [Trichogramma kaykai]
MQSPILLQRLECIAPVNIERSYVQILFIGPSVAGHWIAIYYNRGIIHVYDSANKKYMHDDVKLYINKLFPNKDDLYIIFENVQDQTNNFDCGVFAIANVVGIVNNINPASVEYNILRIREHLYLMYCNEQVQMFPLKVNTKYINLKENKFPTVIANVRKSNIIPLSSVFSSFDIVNAETKLNKSLHSSQLRLKVGRYKNEKVVGDENQCSAEESSDDNAILEYTEAASSFFSKQERSKVITVERKQTKVPINSSDSECNGKRSIAVDKLTRIKRHGKTNITSQISAFVKDNSKNSLNSVTVLEDKTLKSRGNSRNDVKCTENISDEKSRKNQLIRQKLAKFACGIGKRDIRENRKSSISTVKQYNGANTCVQKSFLRSGTDSCMEVDKSSQNASESSDDNIIIHYTEAVSSFFAKQEKSKLTKVKNQCNTIISNSSDSEYNDKLSIALKQKKMNRRRKTNSTSKLSTLAKSYNGKIINDDTIIKGNTMKLRDTGNNEIEDTQNGSDEKSRKKQLIREKLDKFTCKKSWSKKQL